MQKTITWLHTPSISDPIIGDSIERAGGGHARGGVTKRRGTNIDHICLGAEPSRGHDPSPHLLRGVLVMEVGGDRQAPVIDGRRGRVRGECQKKFDLRQQQNDFIFVIEVSSHLLSDVRH